MSKQQHLLTSASSLSVFDSLSRSPKVKSFSNASAFPGGHVEYSDFLFANKVSKMIPFLNGTEKFK
ncbi:hypothetical protein O9G_002520 [Rozella allomycis CSF55]|uniref:Uncharacterized protein n=1 Tax=Rozella allomycis (strain CSF55) TaxID=988480 RepID=A0A075AU65_ROZAC|nr:hypothetical protein O9G_002520 [Rozella allomycis CSF55]|eukprot:EPZ33808.1 hypothetical protein O9G_002520 [Rozella allomycis CSF55]